MASDKWHIPKGSSDAARAFWAEHALKESLDVLEKVRNQIPQTPASETKQLIDNFLTQFKKP